MSSSFVAIVAWVTVVIAVVADIAGTPSTRHAEPVLALIAAVGWTYAANGWK